MLFRSTDIQLDDICFINGGAPLVDGGNLAPSVSITRPSDGQFFAIGDTITIEAAASDADGSVVKVEFFEGSTLLGEDTTAPYSFTWNSVPGGTYTLTARATDNNGATRNASVRVYVGTPTLTRIAITPASATVDVGKTRQFTAAGYDQFDLPFSVNPSWSITGGGTISAAGLFSAAFPGGPFTVTARDGAFSATAAVTVVKPKASCTGGPANGDYTYAVSGDSQNPTITFVPGYAGVGNNIVILYYGTSPAGVYPGVIVSPNVPRQITAAQGQTIYFYYTYSVPSGGERNTSNNRHSIVVGNCTVSVPGDLNGDGGIGLDDLLMLSYYWLDTACATENDFCFGTDTQPDGIVNLRDLAYLAAYWMN